MIEMEMEIEVEIKVEMEKEVDVEMMIEIDILGWEGEQELARPRARSIPGSENSLCKSSEAEGTMAYLRICLAY